MSNATWGGIGGIPQNEMNWATTTREPSGDLDRTAFLNLLITQLRYQDPMNPMDDRDFIAQMAQFSALEQMMNLNATFERTQAFGMIGKVVDATFTCPTSGERIDIEAGLVKSVVRSGQSVYLGVAGEGGRIIDVPFDAVREVSEDFFLSHQLHEIFSHIQGQRATDLIGKYVQGFAVIGDTFEFVEGRVDSISMQDDIAILRIGNRELLFPRDVFAAIGEDGRLLIGSPYFTHGGADGTLTGIDVVTNGNNKRLYLQFSNGSRVHAQMITHVTSALTYVGHRITSGDVVNGLVESITMIGGIPFVNARNADGELVQIDFLRYIAERNGAEVDEPPADDSDTGDTTP